MSRYIDADALMDKLDYEVKMADNWKTAHEIANVVKYAPSIDIVRCKECIRNPNGCVLDLRPAETIDPNGFCCYGTRGESDE